MPVYDKAQTRGYLEELRMSVPMAERVISLIDEFQSFMGTEPEFVFVENPIDALGAVEFSNLICLTGNSYLEFSISQPNRVLTFLNMGKNINRILMPTMHQMSFIEVTERSRLTVQLCTDLQVISFFSASGRNCQYLLDMTKRYFIPAIGT